jgi:predicted nucleic acid-binding protein
MMLVDANLLLYAYHPKSEQHKASRAWLEAALSGAELVRFAWFTLWAFLRISTNPRGIRASTLDHRVARGNFVVA